MKPESEKIDSALHSFVLPFGPLLVVSRSLFFSQLAGPLSATLRLMAELPVAEAEG